MDPLDRIRELVARLAELTAEELTELDDLVDAEFARIEAEAPTPENIQLLGEIVGIAEQSKAEATARVEREAAAVAEAEELRNRFRLVREGEGEAGESDEGDEGEATPPVAEVIEETPAEPAPQRAAASVARAAAMAQSRSVARSPESRSPASAGARLRATGFVAGGQFTVGQELVGKEMIGRAMVEALRRTPRGTPGRQIVASANWMDQYDAAGRRLRSDRSAEANMALVDRAMSAEGIQASGGICLPVNIDYDVPTYATNDRPLKAGLPNQGADRGGLEWVTPPDISDLADAASLWSEATDASPGSDTKPVKQISCGTPVTVLVGAVVTRVGVGNLQGRFSPEQTAANVDLAAAATARVAELNLLAQIDAASNIQTTAQYVGAGRDFLATLDVAASAYRYTHRLDPAHQLTVILPEWAKSLFRADIVRELAHDTGALDPRAVTDAQIEAWISARNVSAIWMLDGRAQDALGNSTNPFQGFVDTGSTVALWPNDSTNVELDWNLFAQGTMQFLDGGELNLGIVRDSTLDATNDYEIFTETFEGIAPRWIDALVIRSVLMPNGASASSVAASGYVVGN